MGVHEVSQMDPETDGPRYPDDEPLPPPPIEEYERKAAADVRVIKARTEMIQVENAGHSTRRTEETAQYRAETERERLERAHLEKMREFEYQEVRERHLTERAEFETELSSDDKVVWYVVRTIVWGIVGIAIVIGLGTYYGHMENTKTIVACVKSGKNWVMVPNANNFECR